MSKELKALECLDIIGCLVTKTTENNEYILLNEDKEFENEFNTVKQALLKLDFLEDAMDLPTNCFSSFKNRNGDEVTIMRRERYEEYQEQEKSLKIIKEKNVDIIYLKDSNNVEEYNNHFGCVICKLTEKEFDLLKRWLNNE